MSKTIDKVTLTDEQTEFINNRIKRIQEINQAISQVSMIIKEKQNLTNELRIVIAEYVKMFGLDPETCILDLENNLILNKKEEEDKKENKNGTAKISN